MIPLTETEIQEIIDLAYNSAEKYILKKVNKKEFEDINITINLNNSSDSFNIDINIELDSDLELPETFADDAIEISLKEVDKYVEERNNKI
ncbi:DUF3194 domain-containing protein [Methanosphaera sp. WGK6]|uniref:DUF3194 domain-containing protein n=1 Tax=Methanosphaera sp. WGK6 TaxID=1561964 RepID=UPI00084BEA1C|nr:DUF3194 domain-containing protein [Methanosphaera sp. WGK6]OED30676.1 hypothetical protein NL43_01670 [Methanosphaera sp. WGK6]